MREILGVEQQVRAQTESRVAEMLSYSSRAAVHAEA
jgi:hypothetical protein